MNRSTIDRPHQFYSTALLPCPYLAGQMERKIITELTGPEAQSLHDTLSRAGFRRSHNIVYRPACPGCDACMPVRIVVDEFIPDKTMRRVLRQNQDLIAAEAPPRATPDQYALFRRYQLARHAEGEMASMNLEDYQLMVEDSPIHTSILEFRGRDHVLKAACLTDHLCDGLSAVYSFFATEEPKRSLGTYMILWLVDYARRLGLRYLYLGYWIPDSRKMAYKARFNAIEVLTTKDWVKLQQP